MTLSMHTLSVGVFVPALEDLAKVLEKAAEHARAQGLGPAALVQARLAPDMYDLARQVQLATFHALNGAALLSGQAPPAMAAEGETLEALQAQIASAVQRLQGADAAAFAGAEDRQIRFPVTGADAEFVMTGLEFLKDWATPHFYFHLVTAYDILRHEGVELGKPDFMAHVGRFIRPRG
ncbi:MAG: DUF1993 family protein [Caulobacterales bacterium]